MIWKVASSGRNYDGAGAAFGDTSIHGQTADVLRTSVYASVDQGVPGRMVLVAVNKHTAALSVGIKVTHTVRFNTAEVYRITSASATPRFRRQRPSAVSVPPPSAVLAWIRSSQGRPSASTGPDSVCAGDGAGGAAPKTAAGSGASPKASAGSGASS